MTSREAIQFANEGQIRAEMRKAKLGELNEVLANLKAGKIKSRVVMPFETSDLITRLYLCALLFLMALVAACNDNAKSVAANPHGTRVEVSGGAYTKVAPQELQTLLANKNFPLINVHVPYEGEIEKTDANISYNEIDKIVEKLPSDKNAMVVLYCRSGRMTQEATEALVILGYTNVWSLDRGMVGWKEAGLPIVTKKLP